jgi:hypothetical protein
MNKIIRLKDMIAKHQRYSPCTSLKNNWGDGYLYKKNRLFRRVRDLTLAQGFRFTTDDFCDYRMFSLAALPEILKQKKIPYQENFKVMEKIENARPGIFEIKDLHLPFANYALHESCHAIAHSMLTPGQDEQGMIVKSFLGESLANTVDFLVCTYSSSEIQNYFIQLNSYLPPFTAKDKRGLCVQKALREVGSRLVFKAVWVSFLFANFLAMEGTKRDFAKALTIIDPEGDVKQNQKDALFSLFQIVVPTLNYNFRLETSAFYFKLFHQIDEPIFEVTDFDFVKYIKNSASLLSEMDAITKSLG